MAKGKKKGNKKESDESKEAGGDVPSVSGLSISDDAPSTSQAPDEDDGGLGLGMSAAARRKLKKQKQLEAKTACQEAKISKESTPEVKPEEKFKTHVEEKPEPKVEEKPESKVEEKPEPKVVEKPEPKTETKPEPKAEAEDDGLGLGLGGGKKRPRKKKTAAAPEPVASRAGSAQPEQAAPSAQPQEPMAMPTQQIQAPVSLTEPPRFTQQGPPLGYPQPPGGLAQQPTGPPGFAPSPQAQSAPWGRGQGRGRGQGPVPQASPSAPGIQPRAPSSMPPTQPLTQQQPVPASSSREMVKIAPSRQEINCRFKIPMKILGRNVPYTATRVITNYLPMEFKPLKVFRYDVTVKPDKPKKMVPQVFKVAKEKTYPREFLAFDQFKNCYSLTALKDVPVDGSARKAIPVDIKDQNGKVMHFEVSFKATGIVDFAKIKQHMESGGSSLNTPSEEIQCIDVILRQGALEAYVKCGRQFFKRPGKPIQLSGGLEMWTGLFQSAIFTSKAFINIDVAHKGFPIQQSLIQAVTGSFRLRTDRPIEDQWGRDSEYFQMFIKNLRVVATLVGPPNNGQKREFICNGLVAPPDKLKFTCERDGKKTVMSVSEYFGKEKGYKIKFPNLNCMWVGPRDRFIYYPMELLDVAYGQALNKQLNEMQLSIMVKEAATPPAERKRKIEEVAASMNYSSNGFFKKFGLEISNQFLQVDAKILTPPSLDCGDRNSITPSRGSWQTNKLVKPEALQSWGFIAIDCDPTASNYENIRSLLMGTGRQMGMAVAEPKLKYFNVKITELRNILFAALDKEVRFLFIIVSARGRDTYHKVKQFAERDVGILTQCIKENTASRRMNPQTMKNILLKVNSKLMGINQVLDARHTPNCIKNGDVMIVGADVTHPSPEQTSIPSIAAVTASMDAKCFSYNIELSIQTPKKEMIVEFADMMYDHLTLYRQRNRALPRKIYVFRDGVSEGQFAQVMNSELSAVHRAYQRFNVPYKPEVLFLLVQKRHHTRFFTVKNCANVEPGTVVDTHIVHPKELDFYLVSHQAIKGTARPTRYHAVCNDGNIPHDEVEQLTYYLCHLYSRCMRSVSYPTPTYYAHLACLRARSLTYGQTFDNNALDTKPQRLRVLDKMLQFSRMFFV